MPAIVGRLNSITVNNHMLITGLTLDFQKYTAQNKYDYMSLYAFFYYADLYIIVEYGIFLKKIQFPVQ